MLSGARFALVMQQWEAVCARFAGRKVFEMNTPFKKIWRDQVAFN